MTERDYYPEGEKAPGVAGEYREWIPAPAPPETVVDDPKEQEAIAAAQSADTGEIVTGEGAVPVPIPTVPKSYHCRLCDKPFPTMGALMQHRATVH